MHPWKQLKINQTKIDLPSFPWVSRETLHVQSRLLTEANRPGLAEACLTPTQKAEDHTRRYARRQKRRLSPGLHAPRACAHCNSVVSSLQLTFTLCRHYPPANNGAHSPARSQQAAEHRVSCWTQGTQMPARDNVTRSQPPHKAWLTAQPKPVKGAAARPCISTPFGGRKAVERVQQPEEPRQGWQQERSTRNKREKKILH